MNRIDCVSCGKEKLDKNTIGLNKKLLGMKVKTIIVWIAWQLILTLRLRT